MGDLGKTQRLKARRDAAHPIRPIRKFRLNLVALRGRRTEERVRRSKSVLGSQREDFAVPHAVKNLAYLPYAFALIVAILAGLPGCASQARATRSPAAYDLDSARSDFDRHTPPGGD